jgi:uncharacterized membrane protein (UPF0136 family)
MAPFSQPPLRAQRLTAWAAALSLPAAVIVGGIVGAWAGNARIGLVLGAAFGFCAAIGLFAALAISAAMRN